ncbi:hypothetical protein [Micromonospora endophytica]|uniref:Uncharacterized protein n=1 Tax=Micromonospora endophytica TaxID=515350 RepID=A0A2W2CGG7_9ACTN|nr:hypothetical protein [Micromonospora endophytica]PZF97642.1 hypothetical protein C1I93_11210 [Micromonospora endophytica]RIW46844.1 hypothetical protein D3H59_11320 [Micromonospora endophytica]BCJ59243.1 hypothetical protein Jiend_26650 [Micromonospora endophytica]
MNRHEVRDALLAAGLSPDAFELEGVHEHVPVPPDFWFLRRSTEGWEIGAYERGHYDVRQVFATEAAACAGLWTALTGRPAPP